MWSSCWEENGKNAVESGHFEGRNKIEVARVLVVFLNHHQKKEKEGDL
ncbi:hypothetical protein LINPERHAP2_LOCUS32548 [Linum perenne]